VFDRYQTEFTVKISAKAEYACVAMVELAIQYATSPVVQLKAIADAHRISPRILVQILMQFKGAGLVASSRGASGGYQLARPPDQINLAEIIAGIDGPPLPQSDPASPASSQAMKTLRRVWQEVNREEQRILEGTRLADLADRLWESDVLSYQI
jgi:Rrf2 family protein